MNIETVRNTIASCSSYKSCKCFDRPLTLQPFNSDNELDYIQKTKNNLATYYTTLVKHINKDLFFGQNFYSSTAAEVLKEALDHHSLSLNQFEKYILKNYQGNENIVFKYDHRSINIYDYVVSVNRLVRAHEQTNRLFNFPDTKISTKQILDEVDLHLYTLELFEKYILFIISKNNKQLITTNLYAENNGGLL